MVESTIACQEIGLALYEQVISEVLPVSCTLAAEMIKFLENMHWTLNIGLMNEFNSLDNRMVTDLYGGIRAAATKPFGFPPYFP